MSMFCSSFRDEDALAIMYPNSDSRVFSFYINYMLLKDSQESKFDMPLPNVRPCGKSQAPADRLLIEAGTNPDLPAFLDAVQKRILCILKDLGFQYSSKKETEEKGVGRLSVKCSALDVNKFFRLNGVGPFVSSVSFTDCSNPDVPVAAEFLDMSTRRIVRSLLPSRIEESLKEIGLSGVMVRSPASDVQDMWSRVWAKNGHAAVIPWLFASPHRVEYALANQATYLSDCQVQGLVRPWILLVSMHPERRRLIAAALGISVPDAYGFKPAAEAHMILQCICHTRPTTSESKQSDDSWLKILVCEANRRSGIDTPDDLLRLDRPANASLARERSNRADDRSEPGRMERLLLQHEQSSENMETEVGENYWRLTGAMEGLEVVCDREARFEQSLEKGALQGGGICYDVTSGWRNRRSQNWIKALFPFAFDCECTRDKTIQAGAVVLAILHQRLILAYENVDFRNLITEATR